MTAEFDWWLLIVGLVVGAGLVWLILAEWPRQDEDLADEEIGLEAGWIAAQLLADGRPIEPDVAEAVLRQHRSYLGLPPPDELTSDGGYVREPPPPSVDPAAPGSLPPPVAPAVPESLPPPVAPAAPESLPPPARPT
jgi:hypothetical protein